MPTDINDRAVRGRRSRITTSSEDGSILVQREGDVLIGRIDGGPHSMIIPGVLRDLTTLVDAAERDESVKTVVLTGTRPGRWISHADVEWLYQGAAASTLGGPALAGSAVALADLARRAHSWTEH